MWQNGHREPFVGKLSQPVGYNHLQSKRPALRSRIGKKCRNLALFTLFQFLYGCRQLAFQMLGHRTVFSNILALMIKSWKSRNFAFLRLLSLKKHPRIQ